MTRLLPRRSHSLGTLIEWKQEYRALAMAGVVFSSHSLGTLIEWKLTPCAVASNNRGGSHSLGTLIEWKPEVVDVKSIPVFGKFPLAGDIN